MKFSHPVSKALKFYVYIYSHPITDEIFYVGKGKGNRIFAHLEDQKESAKVQAIQEILNQGLKPKMEILIHGLEDEVTALRVESAIIDLLGIKNLTNKQSGFKSATFGRMNIDQVNAAYDRQPVQIGEPSILIRINTAFRYSMSSIELYDSTRGQWRVNLRQARKANYAFSVYKGIIQEVYVIFSWFPGSSTFNVRVNDNPIEGRYEFIGNIAPDLIRNKYRFKSVEHYFKKGSANPIMYLNI